MFSFTTTVRAGRDRVVSLFLFRRSLLGRRFLGAGFLFARRRGRFGFRLWHLHQLGRGLFRRGLLLRQFGRLEALPVEGNFGDADGRISLAMAAQFLVLLLALVMGHHDLGG